MWDHVHTIELNVRDRRRVVIDINKSLINNVLRELQFILHLSVVGGVNSHEAKSGNATDFKIRSQDNCYRRGYRMLMKFYENFPLPINLLAYYRNFVV